MSRIHPITKTPILVITSINSRFFAQEVIDSGATYCLVKTTSHERCKEVINKILSGKQIAPFEESKSEIYSNKLTKRQYEVLSEIAQGMLNKQIAVRFHHVVPYLQKSHSETYQVL